MAEEYDHYWEFNQDLGTQVEVIQKKIKQGLDQVVGMFNEAPGLSSNWAWLASPAGKAGYELLKAHFNGQIDQVWEEFKKVCDDLWKRAEQMTGDPWTLMSLNRAYHQAAGRLRDEPMVITTLYDEVKLDWEGDAFVVYEQVGNKQKEAFKGIAGGEGLVEAAHLCADGAHQLRSAWRDIVDELINVAKLILEAIKEGTDAGQWVTFDAGPAIKVIGQIAATVVAAWNRLDRYFDYASTQSMSRWRKLNSGVPGLDAANKWPEVSPSQLGTLDGKEDWKAS